MGCRGGVEYSLVDGLARLGVVVVEDDISICRVDGGDVLLLDDVFRFVVEWDVADTLVDTTDDGQSSWRTVEDVVTGVVGAESEVDTDASFGDVMEIQFGLRR